MATRRQKTKFLVIHNTLLTLTQKTLWFNCCVLTSEFHQVQCCMLENFSGLNGYREIFIHIQFLIKLTVLLSLRHAIVYCTIFFLFLFSFELTLNLIGRNLGVCYRFYSICCVHCKETWPAVRNSSHLLLVLSSASNYTELESSRF